MPDARGSLSSASAPIRLHNKYLLSKEIRFVFFSQPTTNFDQIQRGKPNGECSMSVKA